MPGTGHIGSQSNESAISKLSFRIKFVTFLICGTRDNLFFLIFLKVAVKKREPSLGLTLSLEDVEVKQKRTF